MRFILTLRLHLLSLFGAGLAVAVAADVIEGEEKMMLLVELSWQLNLKLKRRSTNKHVVMFDSSVAFFFKRQARCSYFIVELRILLVM